MSNELEICFKCAKPTKEEAAAIKALHVGEGSPRQQKLALAYIVNKASRSHDLLYIPGKPEDTAFLNGRAFVGQKILKMVKVPIGQLDLIDNKEADKNE